jgi:predicted DsbA family dithiol-disulfide isomerase
MNPLNKADIANIAKNIRDLKDADVYLERAESAGIDVTELAARIQHARATLEQMYRTFGPTGQQ